MAKQKKEPTLEAQINIIKNHPQNKNLSPEQLRQKAQDFLESRTAENQLDIQAEFQNEEEKTLALELGRKYLTDYVIETESDRNTLRQLVFLEILHKRIQQTLNTVHANTTTTPKDAVETLHKNIVQITALKEKLGITRTKSQEIDSKDGYGYLQKLLKKYKVWLEENQATRYFPCPHCGVATMLKIKTDVWEAQKHPFFRDRILGNAHLVELYKQSKLTVDDLAKVFETSTDYVKWLVEKGWKLPIEEKDANAEETVSE